MPEYARIASLYASDHKGEYDIDSFNCVNYSRGLSELYKERGIEHEVMTLCNDTIIEVDGTNHTFCHAYVRVYVDIEPQTGEPLNKSKYGEYTLSKYYGG